MIVTRRLVHTLGAVAMITAARRTRATDPGLLAGIAR
jgi:hypothetical protein